ncbi:HTH domain-containing protein [Chelativorans sp. M5D2P16]
MIAILQTFQEVRAPITATNLAGRLNVSERTIDRD